MRCCERCELDCRAHSLQKSTVMSSIFRVENETTQEAELCLLAAHRWFLSSTLKMEVLRSSEMSADSTNLRQSNFYYPIFTLLATLFHLLLFCNRREYVAYTRRPSALYLSLLILLPWRWERHVLPKRRLTFNRLHGVVVRLPLPIRILLIAPQSSSSSSSSSSMIRGWYNSGFSLTLWEK
jgi:hypothetical protein